MCEVPQMNKKSESTQGNLDECGANEGIEKRRYKPPIIEDHLLEFPESDKEALLNYLHA
jgi:hypothetical protein